MASAGPEAHTPAEVRAANAVAEAKLRIRKTVAEAELEGEKAWALIKTEGARLYSGVRKTAGEAGEYAHRAYVWAMKELGKEHLLLNNLLDDFEKDVLMPLKAEFDELVRTGKAFNKFQGQNDPFDS